MREDNEEVINVILRFDPEHALNQAHERTLRAAEEYEFQRALREAEELRRAELKATREPRGRWYLRLFMRRTSPIRP